jgi:FAD/FMN-containing dehydrogenase
MHWPGASNIQDGVTIDLREMNSVEVLTINGEEVVKLGAGARWGDVYRRLEPVRLVVPGPLTDSVGVGGFLLSRKWESYFSDAVNLDTVINS